MAIASSPCHARYNPECATLSSVGITPTSLGAARVTGAALTLFGSGVAAHAVNVQTKARASAASNTLRLGIGTSMRRGITMTFCCLNRAHGDRWSSEQL